MLCYSNRRVFVDGKEKPSGFVHAIGRQAPEPYGPAVADHLLWNSRKLGFVWGMFGSCTMFTERQLLRQFQFDSQFRRCAEWDLAIRVALAGGHFIAVYEPLVIQHKAQTSDRAGRKPLNYALQLRKNYKEYLQKKVLIGELLYRPILGSITARAKCGRVDSALPWRACSLP